MTTNRTELGELIDYIAAQLIEAEQRSLGRSKRVMQFDECQLELAVQIEQEAKGGIKVYVFEIGAGAKVTDSNRITIKFKPIDGGSTAFLAGESDGKEGKDE